MTDRGEMEGRDAARKLQMITVVGERAVSDGGDTLKCACGNGSAQTDTLTSRRGRRDGWSVRQSVVESSSRQ